MLTPVKFGKNFQLAGAQLAYGWTGATGRRSQLAAPSRGPAPSSPSRSSPGDVHRGGRPPRAPMDEKGHPSGSGRVVKLLIIYSHKKLDLFTNLPGHKFARARFCHGITPDFEQKKRTITRPLSRLYTVRDFA